MSLREVPPWRLPSGAPIPPCSFFHCFGKTFLWKILEAQVSTYCKQFFFIFSKKPYRTPVGGGKGGVRIPLPIRFFRYFPLPIQKSTSRYNFSPCRPIWFPDTLSRLETNIITSHNQFSNFRYIGYLFQLEILQFCGYIVTRFCFIVSTPSAASWDKK